MRLLIKSDCLNGRMTMEGGGYGLNLILS